MIQENPFDFFKSPIYKSFTRDLCADGWPAGVVVLNIAVKDCKKAYEKLEQENKDLKVKISKDRLKNFVSKPTLEQLYEIQEKIRVVQEKGMWEPLHDAKLYVIKLIKELECREKEGE